MDKIPPHIILVIIGDGEQREYLEEIANKLELNNRIDFVGKLNDTNKLMDYYKKAIVSVSFGQAGLTVLQSLGYGVPFITKRNAISGGEKSNIKHAYNGFFCEDKQSSLSGYLTLLCNDIEYARVIGKNAFHYYTKYCTMKNMVQGFRDAIEGTNIAVIDETNNI